MVKTQETAYKRQCGGWYRKRLKCKGGL